MDRYGQAADVLLEEISRVASRQLGLDCITGQALGCKFEEALNSVFAVADRQIGLHKTRLLISCT